MLTNPRGKKLKGKKIGGYIGGVGREFSREMKNAMSSFWKPKIKTSRETSSGFFGPRKLSATEKARRRRQMRMM